MNLDRFREPDDRPPREEHFDDSEPWRESECWGEMLGKFNEGRDLVDCGITPAAVVDDVAREIGVVDAD